jgi:hypothetical protein
MIKANPFLTTLSIGLLGITLLLLARSQLHQVYLKTNLKDLSSNISADNMLMILWFSEVFLSLKLNQL